MIRNKIKYVALSALTLLAVSCAKSNEGNSQGRPVEISPDIESRGRATENAFVDGDKVGVYVSKFNDDSAQPLLSQGNYAGRGDNVAFTRVSGVWSSLPILYWMPGNTDMVDVYGYYPYKEDIADALAVDVEVMSDQNAIASEGALSGYEASDLMYAKSESGVNYGSPVADGFTFKHKLSKVIVNLFKGSVISYEQLARATVTINGTKLHSVLNLSTGELAEASGEVQSITMRKNGTSFEAIVVPQEIISADLIEIDIDGKKFKYNTTFTFAENNSHTFSITVSDVAINVTSNSITGWTVDPVPSIVQTEDQSQGGVAPYMSASFIQSWLIIGWEDDRWEQELKLLKSVGIDDIIVDQSLWYYEADAMGTGKKYLSLVPLDKSEVGMTENITLEWGNALERMLIACKRNDMGVYVGLNFDSRYWFKVALKRDVLLQQAQMGNAVMSKIMDLYGNDYNATIKGWYWSWEVDNVNLVENATYKNQTLLADMLAINVNHRNSNPQLNKPIILSPFMNPRGGGMTSIQYRNMWTKVFEKVDFRSGDAMAPQDCMGTGYLNLQNAAEWLGNLSIATSTKPGMEFWVNTEIFTDVAGTFQTAKVSDVIDRLQFDSKFGTRLICFSYSHYFSEYLNPAFQSYHNEYKRYYETKK